MDKFVIKGPAKIQGKITVDGSKNAALPIIAGTLLIQNGTSIIRNVPPLRDIFTMIEMLRFVGAKVEYDVPQQVVTVNAKTITESTAPYELMRQMRASFLVLGPLLSRLGEAKISLPGGCSLGARPVDYHIKGFAALGAKISEQAGYVIASGKPLKGGEIYFDKPSHTGTENILFGAVFAKNKTIITNAACDPEIADVANFLIQAGAKISGVGTPTITVEPVKKLKAVDHTVSGDRLVAGTYLIASAMTGGKIDVKGIPPEDLTMVIHKLREMGCTLTLRKNGLSLTSPKKLSAVNVTTFPFPGFPTDLQACIMSATCLASGTSHIRETVFTDRFSHTMELRRLGADINISSDEAIINGVNSLSGAEVMSPDIRAGAGLLLACLAAKGKSELMRVYHIDRGYYQLEEKLAGLGADIVRAKA
ncbi:MAG: UDP-N-acetylglucosamine 1-carboxyvinyltransferase [candidate division Zixibacteria bacterium]|mgnify:CR=1 FL=1|nr:UDP-N-acetylglucosamine 1-carboxyvinyltransferase [candidate division Zixibacteria bacterium]